MKQKVDRLKALHLTVSLYRCDMMIIAIYFQVCKIGGRTTVNNYLVQNLWNNTTRNNYIDDLHRHWKISLVSSTDNFVKQS